MSKSRWLMDNILAWSEFRFAILHKLRLHNYACSITETRMTKSSKSYGGNWHHHTKPILYNSQVLLKSEHQSIPGVTNSRCIFAIRNDFQIISIFYFRCRSDTTTINYFFGKFIYMYFSSSSQYSTKKYMFWCRTVDKSLRRWNFKNWTLLYRASSVLHMH